MSRRLTTTLLPTLFLSLHLLIIVVSAPLGAHGATLRLVNSIYSGADGLSLLEWIFDYPEGEAATPKQVRLFFEHEDYDHNKFECFPTQQRAYDAHGPMTVYCVELATVYGSDFRSKPVVPYQDGNYTFRISYADQHVRAPVFPLYIDANGELITSSVDDEGNRFGQVTIPSITSTSEPTPTASLPSRQTTIEGEAVPAESRHDLKASEKAGIAIGAICLGSLIFGMFIWDYLKNKSRKTAAAAADAAADKGDGCSSTSSHSTGTGLAELDTSEEKLVSELGQPEQRVELSGGVREERAELPAEIDVYELDSEPMRWSWKDDNHSELEWMQSHNIGSEVSVVSPITVSPATVDGKGLR
ncbi:hypothetical protein B0T20DRAFT_55813 [Sordaria brevicollis]|uniref:Uncharacterized protein n=1 Tax=Sordaria brevicollis TaxID=83679 RepID=A0AAE0P352_SORBR|nr:hypothetical protein B0T20DRAFT_55813 [Sordaria brevicollis]